MAIFVIKKGDNFYKNFYKVDVKYTDLLTLDTLLIFTRLNSEDPNDIYINKDKNCGNDVFTESLGFIIRSGYYIIGIHEKPVVEGGKKSRNNRKHKTKLEKKRRTARKHAY
jgi:heptaprenylglyceryl phosphate synthase